VRERGADRASFELVTNPSPSRQDIMTLVQADLARIGIEARPRVREAQSLGRDLTSPERSFDAAVLGWSADFVIDDRVLFSCSHLEGAYQWASYCNPRVDSLLERVAVMEDRSQTLPLWHEYQEILQREQPYTFLYYEVRANGIRSRLRDVRMDIRGALVNVGDWWIAPAERRQPRHTSG
jgi:peptide/nickel transport system substrate-binding protein